MTEEWDFNVKKLKSATLDHGSLDSPQFHDGAANHKRKGCQGGCETELPRALDPFPKPSFSFPESYTTPWPTQTGSNHAGLHSCLVYLGWQSHGVTRRNSHPSTLSLQQACKLEQEIGIISTKASPELRSQGNNDERII